jgi:4-hydroxy-4-methyl-2-oxoglutarate aldolase
VNPPSAPDLPDWLSATLASDATAGRGVLPSWIATLRTGARVAGPALVVAVSRDDNRPMRDVAAARPARGTVLVVAGGGESRTACMGDLVARELVSLGIAGVVTDGLVRDSAEVRGLPIAVWCRGTTPAASRKDGPGEVGGAVTIGGVVVRDGDLVIADDDGVVVWRADEVAALLEKADAKRVADDERLAAITQG